MIIQFCGLSGSGKTTLAQIVKNHFEQTDVKVEVMDGDEYRKLLCSDLKFSKNDRNTNIRRLAFIASKFAQYHIIPIICAINPYEEIRKEVSSTYPNVKTIYIKCSIEELIRRDTKGLYARSMLPENNINRVSNLSGINDPFEVPQHPDLIIDTERESIIESGKKLLWFIEKYK